MKSVEDGWIWMEEADGDRAGMKIKSIELRY